MRHVWKWQKVESKEVWSKCTIEIFDLDMKVLGTPKAVLDIIAQCLQQWRDNESFSEFTLANPIFAEAVSEQDAIGW